MSAYVTEWDVPSTGSLAEISRRFPSLTCAVRPLGFRWAIRCTGPEAAIRELCDRGITDPTYLRFMDRSGTSVIFAYAPRGREMSVLRRIAADDGFVLPPMVLRDGALRIRFISTSRNGATGGSPRAFEGRLVSRRRLTAPRLREELERQAPGLAGLTSRQTEVLLAAVRAGYYEVPRRANVHAIAETLSLGRSTTEEHLRAAESAVIRAAAPLVELARAESTSGDSDEPLAHFAQFSSELELYVDVAFRGNRVAQVALHRSDPGYRRGPAPPQLRRVMEHLRTGRDDLRDIPVQLDVTPFEREVLEELRRIPLGETRTYAQIAQRIGHPAASRAVGNACAHNPVPIVIPCHRVVPVHGGVGRYSAEGGEVTKSKLLAREGAAPPPAKNGSLAMGTVPEPNATRSSARVARRARSDAPHGGT